MYLANSDADDLQVALESLVYNIASAKIQQCHREIQNLNKTVNELSDKVDSLTNQLNGVENWFFKSFVVNGSTDLYYPVAIAVHRQSLTRSPLQYEIHRSYWEKSPDSLRPLSDTKHNPHYPALTFKFFATEGGWGAAGNTIKVLYHQWNYNKTVGKIELGRYQDYRVIVWLRGGGILYHIKSPVDLTRKCRCMGSKFWVDGIKVYYNDNELECPEVNSSPALYISPVPVGHEDANLVKKGQYNGWAF